MEALWATSTPLSVREVLEELNRSRRPPLAYTTVMTVMARLAEKEVLTRVKDGRGYRYQAAVADAAGIAARDLLRDFGEGAVASFVEQASRDPKLLARLERLMREKR